VRHCQSGQPLRQCNTCTGWDIYDHPKALTYCAQLHGYPKTQMSNIVPPMHRAVNEQHLVPHQSSFEWLSRGVQLAEMEVRLGNWSKGQCDAYLRSMGLNKALSETVYDTAKHNAACANEDIKCPIPPSWKTNVSLDMFIEAPMHLLFLGIVKSIMEVSDTYMKQYRLGNKFISHANTYIAQLQSFHLDFLQIRPLPNTNYLSEWCLGMARVFPYIYGMVTSTIEPTIHYGDKYMCMIYSMYVMISHLMSRRHTSSQQYLQHIKLFLDCCHQFCKATHDDTITPFWLSKGNYVTLLNLPEQIERFGPLRDYWEGTRERYIHLIKRQLTNMRRTYTFMSSKLTEVHQSNVLDWIMHNFDPVESVSSYASNGLFHTYCSMEAILNNVTTGKIISGYHHPQYPRHVIVAYREADKMLGLVAFQANIGVDEQYESGMYFCRFSEVRELATSSPRQYINENVTVGAVMLPLAKTNQQFQMQYSVIYSDWDVLKSNGDKGQPQMSYDLF
jgi:hypothetical protein